MVPVFFILGLRKTLGNAVPIVSECWGDDYFDENDCVKWWGLKNPDVEWYRLEEVKDEDKG